MLNDEKVIYQNGKECSTAQQRMYNDHIPRGGASWEGMMSVPSNRGPGNRGPAGRSATVGGYVGLIPRGTPSLFTGGRQLRDGINSDAGMVTLVCTTQTKTEPLLVARVL